MWRLTISNHENGELQLTATSNDKEQLLDIAAFAVPAWYSDVSSLSETGSQELRKAGEQFPLRAILEKYPLFGS